MLAGFCHLRKPCVQIHGQLEVSPELEDGDLQLGRLTIAETGSLSVGSRSEMFGNTFQFTLNSSLLPQLDHLSAVSTMDIHGSLQLFSADLELEDGAVRSWKAIHFADDSFTLELDGQPTGIAAGTDLGVVSSHGDEVVQVEQISNGGKVKLQSNLKVKHGSKAIIYKLSRRVRVRGVGPAYMRVWNGQHHAGNGVSPLAPPTGHHHRRRMHSAIGNEMQLEGAHLSEGPDAGSWTRGLLEDESDQADEAEGKYSNAGYSGTYICHSTVQPDDTGGLVELMGVEMEGLGVEGELAEHAAIEVVDHACAIRWPEYRKYISISSSTIHSSPAGCIVFNGCTGGFEVRARSLHVPQIPSLSRSQT